MYWKLNTRYGWISILSSKNINPPYLSYLRFVPHLTCGTFRRQSITKIQFKDREQPPVEKNYTDLDKVLSELFRPLVRNYLLLFLVVFSSFKVIPSFQKIDYHLEEVSGKEENQKKRYIFMPFLA